MQNVALPLTYRNGESARARQKRVREVLEQLGLSNRLHHLPSQLSGGQSQRGTHNEEQARQTDRIIRFFDGRQVL